MKFLEVVETMSEKIESNIETFETTDLYLSSFLTMSEIYPKLEPRNRKVIFKFLPSEDLYKLMVKYNANVSVPVYDFVTAIKSLKAQMIAIKGESSYQKVRH